MLYETLSLIQSHLDIAKPTSHYKTLAPVITGTAPYLVFQPSVAVKEIKCTVRVQLYLRTVRKSSPGHLRGHLQSAQSRYTSSAESNNCATGGLQNTTTECVSFAIRTLPN